MRKQQGKIIRVLRERQGLSQVKLSTILKISSSQLSRYERGLKDFDIEAIKNFAKALKVTPEFLLGLPEKK